MVIKKCSLAPWTCSIVWTPISTRSSKLLSFFFFCLISPPSVLVLVTHQSAFRLYKSFVPINIPPGSIDCPQAQFTLAHLFTLGGLRGPSLTHFVSFVLFSPPHPPPKFVMINLPPFSRYEPYSRYYFFFSFSIFLVDKITVTV